MFWEAHFEGKGRGNQFAPSIQYVHCRGTVLILVASGAASI